MKTTNIVSEQMKSEQVSGTATAMTIDEDSSVFMMDMLGKLYARPAQAALREYLSNAQDAHVSKGGVLPPIQVTLPDAQTYTVRRQPQTLSIRDFGNGMSEEEFKTILSRYGKSTKRDSNELIGGFGLGAKAGFALGDEFFMTSYQNGQGLRVRIFKDSTNQGYVEVIERFTTAEPDGMLVEVTVPAGNISEFEPQALRHFFWAYDSKTITITPCPEVHHKSFHNADQFSPLEFDGNVVGWFGNRDVLDSSSHLYAIVGKVTYKLRLYKVLGMGNDSAAVRNLRRYQTFFRNFERVRAINLPIGSIDMPSSREEITMSERSVQTIHNVLSQYVGLLHVQLQNEINAATYLDAMLCIASLEHAEYPRVSELSWRGKKLGVALLASSNAGILKLSGVSAVENSNVSLVANTLTFSNLTSSGKGVIVIPAEDDAEVERIQEELAEEGAISSLCLHLQSEGPQKSDDFLKITCLIMSKTDPLYEMFADAPVLETSILTSVFGIAEKKRQLLAEAEEKKRLALLAAAEARRLREAAMVTSFLLVDDDRHFPARRSPDEVYEDETEEKYYWSQEEVERLTSSNLMEAAFPYTYSGGELNLYRIIHDSSSSYPNVLHTHLCLLLGSLLPKKSRIILLGSQVNLDEFKAQNPTVGSAVDTVKALLGVALENDDSELSIMRNILTSSEDRSNEVPRTLGRFSQAIEPSQRAMLSSDFKRAMDQSEKKVKDNPNGRGCNAYDMDKLLSVFVPDVPQPRNALNEQALKDKYPLLFIARSFDTVRVVEDMIEYIISKG